MSLALSSARTAVRQLIRDVDVSAPAVKGYVLDQAISNHYQLMHASLHVPVEWQTLTAISANDADYTLTTPEFHSIGLFRLASNFHLIEKVGPTVMARMRDGAVANHLGEPFIVTITEEHPATVGVTETTIQLYPTPTAADTLQGLYASIATQLSASGDLIQLGQNGQRAVEYAAAVELLAGMDDDDAKRLGVNRNKLADEYRRTAAEFRLWELTRISRQRSARYANTSYTRP